MNIIELQEKLNKIKIDKRKKYRLVFDVETANSSCKKGEKNDGLVYDLGFMVIDNKGRSYFEKSLVITDIFDDMQDIMKSAYYNKKLPQYYKQLEEGKRERVSIFQAKKIIRIVMEYFNITEVYAYNAIFDLTTLNNTIRYVSKSLIRYFFPYGTKVCDIWHIACQILGTQKTFQWENIRNENNNLITSAERMFGYMLQEKFVEEHTGLEDTKIEAQILVRCLNSHKSIDKSINRACWRIPQKVA